MTIGGVGGADNTPNVDTGQSTTASADQMAATLSLLQLSTNQQALVDLNDVVQRLAADEKSPTEKLPPGVNTDNVKDIIETEVDCLKRLQQVVAEHPDQLTEAQKQQLAQDLALLDKIQTAIASVPPVINDQDLDALGEMLNRFTAIAANLPRATQTLFLDTQEAMISSLQAQVSKFSAVYEAAITATPESIVANALVDMGNALKDGTYSSNSTFGNGIPDEFFRQLNILLETRSNLDRPDYNFLSDALVSSGLYSQDDNSIGSKLKFSVDFIARLVKFKDMVSETLAAHPNATIAELQTDLRNQYVECKSQYLNSAFYYNLTNNLDKIFTTSGYQFPYSVKNVTTYFYEGFKLGSISNGKVVLSASTVTSLNHLGVGTVDMSRLPLSTMVGDGLITSGHSMTNGTVPFLAEHAWVKSLVQDASSSLQAALQSLQDTEVIVKKQAAGESQTAVESLTDLLETLQTNTDIDPQNLGSLYANTIDNLQQLGQKLVEADALQDNAAIQNQLATDLETLATLKEQVEATPPVFDTVKLNTLSSILGDFDQMATNLPASEQIEFLNAQKEAITNVATAVNTFIQTEQANIPADDQTKINDLVNTSLWQASTATANEIKEIETAAETDPGSVDEAGSLQERFFNAILNHYMPGQETYLRQQAQGLNFSNWVASQYNTLLSDTSGFQSASAVYNFTQALTSPDTGESSWGYKWTNYRGSVDSAKSQLQNELTSAQQAVEQGNTAIDSIDKILASLQFPGDSKTAQFFQDTDVDLSQKMDELREKLLAQKASLQTAVGNMTGLVKLLSSIKIVAAVTYDGGDAVAADGFAIQIDPPDGVYSAADEAVVKTDWQSLLSNRENAAIQGTTADPNSGLDKIAQSLNSESQNAANQSQTQQMQLQLVMTQIQQEWTIVSTALQILNQVMMGFARGVRPS